MPLVHGVMPQAAHTACQRRLEEGRLVEWLSALRMSDRLCVPGNDCGMCEPNSSVAHRLDGLWQVGELLPDMKAISGSRRGHLSLMPKPADRRDRSPVLDARL